MTDNTVLPSNRRFGILMTAVFGGFGAYSWIAKGTKPQGISLVLLSVLFGIASLAAPQLLGPLNRLWFQLGLLLGRIINPLVLGLMYFLVITPVGLLGRLAGRDVLGLRRRDVATHWRDRHAFVPAPDSFKNQF